MIKEVTVINHLGDQLAMSLDNPWKTGLAILEIDGLGPPKATINTEDVATYDGSIFNSAFVDNRNIVFSFQFLETDRETIEDIRHKTYKYFPLKKQVGIIVKTDRRSLMITGYVESNEPTIFSKNEGCQISIICTDPYFKSLNKVVNVFNNVEPEFEFPFSDDPPKIIFGSIKKQQDMNIVYDGDAETGVTIRIYISGPVGTITIVKRTTSESIIVDKGRISKILGSGLSKGDELVINTMPGSKGGYVLRNGRIYNILNAISRDCDWFKLDFGDNQFTFKADSGSEYIDVAILYDTLFEGV